MVLPRFDSTIGRQHGTPVRQASAPRLLKVDDLSLYLVLSRPREGGFPGLEEVRVGAPIIDGPGGSSISGKENDDRSRRWLASGKLQTDLRPCGWAAGPAPGISLQGTGHPDHVVPAPAPASPRAEPQLLGGR